MKRRSLFLLMAALVLSVFGCALPQSGETPAAPEEGVVRIGDTVYATIHDAVEHASNGDTLVLLEDIEIDRTVEIRGKEITLIPEGNRTILRCPAFREELFYIAEGGGLHLEGQKGELIIDGNREKMWKIHFDFDASDLLKKNGIKSLVVNKGIFSIAEGVTLCNNASLRQKGGAIFNRGNFIMDGGKIWSNRTDVEGGGIYNEENGTLIMNEGEILENEAYELPVGEVHFYFREYFIGGGISNHGMCKINNGKIIKNKGSVKGGGIANMQGGNLIIKGGEISQNFGGGGGVYNHQDNTNFSFSKSVNSY